MQKATLTGRQGLAAVFAGIIGHFLFAAGWILLGLVLLGGILTAVLGGAIGNVGDLFKSEGFAAVVDRAGGLLGSVVIGLLIASAVLMIISIVVSGLILRGGRVRKPWGTTWSAVLISAIIDVPLIFVYVSIARATDGLPFILIALIGTVVVGILVWLWMTWGHRGPAVETTGTAAVTD